MLESFGWGMLGTKQEGKNGNLALHYIDMHPRRNAHSYGLGTKK